MGIILLRLIGACAGFVLFYFIGAVALEYVFHYYGTHARLILLMCGLLGVYLGSGVWAAGSRGTGA